MPRRRTLPARSSTLAVRPDGRPRVPLRASPFTLPRAARPTTGDRSPRLGPSAKRRSHVALANRFTRARRKSMTTTNPPAAQGGSYRVGDLHLNRIGYGAMQLAGPGVFG